MLYSTASIIHSHMRLFIVRGWNVYWLFMKSLTMIFHRNFLFIKSVALQLRRAKTDWSGCCQMAVHGTSWLAKRLSLNLNFGFLKQISLLLNEGATQLSLWGWVHPFPDPTLPEKFLGYSRESNPGPLGWQSDVLTTIPSRRSKTVANSTWCSQAVSHPSTNHAQCCLTSMIVREPVFSTRYGRWHFYSLFQ